MLKRFLLFIWLLPSITFANQQSLKIEAEKGNAEAQYLYAGTFKFDSYENEFWLRKAANQGHRDARISLAGFLTYQAEKMYLSNDVVKKQSYIDEAIELYKLESEMGDSMASFHLAQLYNELDRAGLKRNKDEALKWYLKSYEQNKTSVMSYLLAEIYEIGDIVPKDIIEAKKWYRIACDNIHIMLVEKEKSCKRYKELSNQ